ncbi:15-hydroxyprostaglandin dehydrogenase [NAD(+)]-like [Onthophagus taurus]|uniref:15-hydroxyprostaglandin dehydrogenase [NAD(+)]-like n=1 Tax=Onthophagus taurus TaxID=166361 RepID=UPI000C206723|nr:15-hydroxyprostaglandin dehydrogenase [NAD(+)]-like [Onthophagus taurus]
MFDFLRKVALITGGAKGIGLKYAEQLLKNGIKGISIIDCDVQTGQKTTEILQKSFKNSHIIFIEADTSNEKSFDAAFKETISKFGQLDIVLNNAGIWNELTPQKMIDINLKGTTTGTLLAFQKYLPKYKSGDEGIIINTSSLAGLIPVAFTPVYCATKHGIVALSRTLGIDAYYEKNKVRVHALCAGPTDTPMCQIPQEECLFPQQIDVMNRFMEKRKMQKPDVVAEAMIEILKNGKNGSIWLVNEDERYEVQLPEVVTRK